MHTLKAIFYQEKKEKYLLRYEEIFFIRIAYRIESIDEVSLQYWIASILRGFLKKNEHTGKNEFDLGQRIEIQVEWGPERYFFTVKRKYNKNNFFVGFNYQGDIYEILKCNRYHEIVLTRSTGGNDLTPYLNPLHYQTLENKKRSTPIIYTGMIN